MTKVEWILTIIAIGLGVAMIVSSILHVLREREIKQTRRAYWKHRDANILLEEKYTKLKEESNKMAAKYIAATAELHKADEMIEKQIDEITHLHAQNADLREALQEKIVEIKALQMQTVEVEEVKPEPARPPRVGRGKKQ